MNPEVVQANRARVEEFQREHRTGLVTLVFTDIVGSTALKQQVGDRQAVALMQKHHAVVRELVAGFLGAREISTAGDSFFLVFAKPSDAVKFALLLHGRLREAFDNGRSSRREEAPPSKSEIRNPKSEIDQSLLTSAATPIRDRIGIHVGEVVIEEEQGSAQPKDLFGIHVDTCARVMALGGANQILLTRAAFDNARSALRGEDVPGVKNLRWANHGPYQLKGVEEPIEICEVRAFEGPLTPPSTSEKAQRYASPDSEPVLGWRPALDQVVPNTKWVLEEKLGEGGFGEVWLGRHQTMKERRVFKFCFRADRVRSLKREMTLFRLIKERIGDHPNIVAIREVYFDEPPFYIEMDYVEGKDLKHWCEQQGGVEKVPLATRLEIMAQVADALQAAHDSGVIHRDVKPGNILVSNPKSEIRNPKSEDSQPSTLNHQPSAKLTDFGIGQVLSQEYLAGITKAGFTQTMLADSSSSHTGTQMYMAPELLAGKPASIRSDIYSLGVVLYQLVVGDLTRPLTTDWAREISDPLLRDDLQHCFAGNPQDRFAGAGQLAKNLRALPQRQAALAKQQAELAARERAAYRRGIMRTAVAAAVIVLAVTILAVSAVQQRNRARTEELTNRRLRYAAEVNLAQHALHDGNIDRALELLEAQRAKPGQPDMRGFEWRFLRQFCHSDELFTLHGHEGLVQSVAVSPEGKFLASGDNDVDFVHIWDVAKRRELIPALDAGGNRRSVVFSPDGKLLAAGGFRGIRLWDTTTWQAQATLTGQASHVERVAFSPDSKLLAAAATQGDELVRLWSLATKQVLATFSGPGYRRACVAFSPDGHWLAFGQSDNTVKLVEVQTRKEAGTLQGHQNVVTYLDFSPDAKTLASASSDGTVKLWDMAARREIGALVGHKAHVTSVAFSPDGRTLATSCSDATIKLWDFASRQEFTTLRGHTKWVNNVVFFPDGKMLASGSDDLTIKIWHARPKSHEPILGGVKNVVTSVDLSPDGKLIVTGNRNGAVTLWDVASQNIQATLRAAIGTNVHCVFSPNGQALLTAGDDGKVKLWNVATRKELLTLSGREGVVQDVVFSRDGRRVATLSEGNTVKLWEVGTGEELGTYQGEDFWFLVPSPNGRIFVLGGAEKKLRLWDVASHQVVVTFTGANDISFMIFSPDLKLVATGDDKGNVFLWDVATGDRVGPLPGHTDRITSCAFSPDGKALISTSYDKTAKLWDVARRREIATLRGHSGWVQSASFSPDGRTLATTSMDGTAKLWSLVSYRELLTLPGHIAPFSTVNFTPDGNALVCRGEDGLVRLWRAPSLAELEVAEKVRTTGN